MKRPTLRPTIPYGLQAQILLSTCTFATQPKHKQDRKATSCQACQNLLYRHNILVIAEIIASKGVLMGISLMYAANKQTSLRTEALDLGGTPLIRAQASISIGRGKHARLTGRSPGNPEVVKKYKVNAE